ncbi:MAG: Sec-independent protein translocase protein TatB [Thermodesulfobacteriota bacterium]
MFGIGMPEFLLILVVALVVLGPKKLPELARTIGKALAEFKKTAEELKENISLGEDLKEVQKDIKDLADPAAYLDTPLQIPSAEDRELEKTEAKPLPEASPEKPEETP